MSRLFITFLILWVTGGGGYYLYSEVLNPHSHDESSVTTNSEQVAPSLSVAIILPISLASGAVATSYPGDLLAPGMGRIHPPRAGFVTRTLVDIGDNVKAWQIVAELAAVQTTPELASILAEKKSAVISAQWRVIGAQIAYDEALSQRGKRLATLGAKIDSAKNAVALSTSARGTLAVSAQNTYEATLKEIDGNIQIAQNRIATERSRIESDLTTEKAKLDLKKTTLRSSVAGAWNEILDIFYGGQYTGFQPSGVFKNGRTLGAVDASSVPNFENAFTRGYAKYKNLQTMSDDDVGVFAKETESIVSKGLLLLEKSIALGDYTTDGLAADRKRLVTLRLDPDIGLITILNSFSEQAIIVAGLERQQTTQIRALEIEVESLAVQKEKLLVEWSWSLMTRTSDLARSEIESQSALNDAQVERSSTIADTDLAVSQALQSLTEARGDLAASESALATLQGGAFSNVIRSPITGTIARRSVQVGDAVEPSSSLFDIVEVVSTARSARFVRVSIPESDLAGAEVGSGVIFSPLSDPLSQRTGTISRLAASVDSATRSVLMEIDLSDELHSDLKIGSQVRVRLADRAAGFNLPSSSIVQESSGTTAVWVVNSAGTLQKKVVKIARVLPERVEIVSGISAEDRVVIDAKNPRLEEGIAATVTDKSAPVTTGESELVSGHDHAPGEEDSH